MIAVRTTRLALALLFAAAPATVSAQAVTDIAIGQTLTKKAGTKTDIYRFVGGSGTTIKATLTVTLEAILPLNNVFLISVLRENGAKPYTLRVLGDEPDLHLALFAHKSGYTVKQQDKSGPYLVSRCWIDPGLKLRTTFPKGVEELAIGRGGKEFAKWKLNGGQWQRGEREVRFEGDKVVFHRIDKPQPDDVSSLEGMLKAGNLDKYQSYLCEPGS